MNVTTHSKGILDKMRKIIRTIASAAIFSADGKLLMGRKDPLKGGVYPDIWHIPGGGVEGGESLEASVIREVRQETGLGISLAQLRPLQWVGKGESLKTLETGEQVLAQMVFYRFEVVLGETAAQLAGQARPGDDLIELRWFDKSELEDVVKESPINDWFKDAGYIAS